MNRTFWAIIVIAVQALSLSSWIAYEQWRLSPSVGESIFVKTVPVDPRDLLRGQYINLRYTFSRPNRSVDANKANETVWVILRQTKNQNEMFYEPFAFSTKKPDSVASNDVLLRGTFSNRGQIDFGIEKYFVPFGTETPNPNSITVRLRIGSDHRPRIETVFVDGKSWP